LEGDLFLDFLNAENFVHAPLRRNPAYDSVELHERRSVKLTVVPLTTQK
jgi:hypothetical protein